MYNYRKSLNNGENLSNSKRWQTTTSLALHETAKAIKELDREEQLGDNRLRKHVNTKSSISFGNDSIDYTSDYQRGYGTIDIENYKTAGQHREHMKSIKADLRATHWTFGNEKVQYVTDTKEALKLAEGQCRADEVLKNIERAKQMKADLQKTSYVIGNDADYM